ncbi:hypothetical protein JTB14_017074 [Gonioctena quinquepunctata]|nr:hypothetical protein JTB14_017074 [Gonioctena quinquepunctata]
MFRVFIIVVFASILSEGKKLPTYLKTCDKTSSSFNTCVKEHGIEAIPYILKGDRSFKNPPLNPLHLDLIEIKPSDKLTIKLVNITLQGIETVIIKDINFDLEKQHIFAELAFSHINLISEYAIDGQILVLQLHGKGPANITLENVEVTYNMDYKLKKKANGKIYMDEDFESKVTYKIGKSNFYMGNLLTGNEEIDTRFMGIHQL